MPVSILFLVVLFALHPVSVWSRDKGKQEAVGQSEELSLPYVFYNDNFGLTAGYVYGVSGQPQPQSTLLTTVMAGTKGSAMGFFTGRDLLLPKTERLFLDPVVSVGYFRENDIFIDGRPGFENQRSGSRDSNKEDYVTGDGWDLFFRMKLKYLLPIGDGDKTAPDGKLGEGDGIQSSPSSRMSSNPLLEGKTYLELQPFYRSLAADGENVDVEMKTNGINVGILWDNRNSYANPSLGYAVRARYSRDFGWLDSSGSWTSTEAEIDAYFPLGASTIFRQRVLAFDFWTAYSPSWREHADGTIEERPPAYTGASLGGLWRMRGYPAQRFSDKAAVYYGLELRLTPEWNPIDQWSWLHKHIGAQWVQFVPFAELGTVSESWNLKDLHREMKWCLGLGVRVLAQGIVARIDAAGSEEDFKLQMMISQPFQF